MNLAVIVYYMITMKGCASLLMSNYTLGMTNITRLELPSLPWQTNDGYCRRDATCILRNSTCFGVPLSYSETSPDIVATLFKNKNLYNFKEIEKELLRWETLRKAPKCWQALQPFLCALYLPKCEHGKVYLLSQERCKYMMATCKILHELPFQEAFPLIDCEDVEHFPPTCKTDVRDLRSNLTGECIPPLIPTDDAESYYDVISGCGVQCENPLLTKEEHHQIHKMIAILGITSFICNLFAVACFLVEWRSGSKYPALIIFYINLCFVISNIGWLVQFVPHVREDIVCKKDLTLRTFEPSAGENLTCVAVFVAVYYPLMAATVWFVNLTYAWHISLRALGKIKSRINKKGPYFHMVAWSVPLVLTIITMSWKQIEGDSITGICFVRNSEWTPRFLLVLAPIGVAILTGCYFLSRGLPFLYGVRRDSREIMSTRASKKIHKMIVRMCTFSCLCLICVTATFICHFYDFAYQETWQKSLQDYIFCRILASISDGEDCKMKSSPSVAMIQLQLLFYFGAGIVMSSWVWTSSTLKTWKRFYNRIFHKEVQEPIVLKKHKIIAKAFAKRKELTNAGKLDLSIRNSHTDPVGLKFEFNSSGSQLSSNWIATIPKLVDRRDALVEAIPETTTNKRRNSYDSESYTYSVRRVSLESRRHSLDSQISLQISEVTTTRKTNRERTRPRGKKRRRDLFRRKNHQRMSRRQAAPSHENRLKMILPPDESSALAKALRVAHASTQSMYSISTSEPENFQPEDLNISSESESLCRPGEGVETNSDSDQISIHDYNDDYDQEEEELSRVEQIVARRIQENQFGIRDMEYQKKSYTNRKYNPKTGTAGTSHSVKITSSSLCGNTRRRSLKTNDKYDSESEIESVRRSVKVDVGTQTDSDDPTRSPPFHIRAINKALAGNRHRVH